MKIVASVEMGASLAVWIFAFLISVGAVWVIGNSRGGRYFVWVAAPAVTGALAVSAFVPILRWHLIWFTPLVLFIAFAFAFRRLIALGFRAQQLVKAGPPIGQNIQKSSQRVATELDGEASQGKRHV